MGRIVLRQAHISGLLFAGALQELCPEIASFPSPNFGGWGNWPLTRRRADALRGMAKLVVELRHAMLELGALLPCILGEHPATPKLKTALPDGASLSLAICFATLLLALSSSGKDPWELYTASPQKCSVLGRHALDEGLATLG